MESHDHAMGQQTTLTDRYVKSGPPLCGVSNFERAKAGEHSPATPQTRVSKTPPSRPQVKPSRRALLGRQPRLAPHDIFQRPNFHRGSEIPSKDSYSTSLAQSCHADPLLNVKPQRASALRSTISPRERYVHRNESEFARGFHPSHSTICPYARASSPSDCHLHAGSLARADDRQRRLAAPRDPIASDIHNTHLSPYVSALGNPYSVPQSCHLRHDPRSLHHAELLRRHPRPRYPDPHPYDRFFDSYYPTHDDLSRENLRLYRQFTDQQGHFNPHDYYPSASAARHRLTASSLDSHADFEDALSPRFIDCPPDYGPTMTRAPTYGQPVGSGLPCTVRGASQPSNVAAQHENRSDRPDRRFNGPVVASQNLQAMSHGSKPAVHESGSKKRELAALGGINGHGPRKRVDHRGQTNGRHNLSSFRHAPLVDNPYHEDAKTTIEQRESATTGRDAMHTSAKAMLPPWNKRLSGCQKKEADGSRSANSINGGLGAVRRSTSQEVLDSPVDSLKLREYSGKQVESANVPVAAKDKECASFLLPDTETPAHYFIETPIAQRERLKNDISKSESIGGNLSSVKAGLSVLAERFQNHSDASDDDGVLLETAMRKTIAQPDILSTHAGACGSARDSTSRKPSEGSAVQLEDQQEATISCEPSLPGNTTTKITTLNVRQPSPTSKVESRSTPGGSALIVESSEVIPILDRNQQQTISNSGPFDQEDEETRAYVSRRIDTRLSPSIASIAMLSTPSAATGQSPNIHSTLGVAPSPSALAQTGRSTTAEVDTNVGTSVMPDEMLSFLSGKHWQYDYGSSYVSTSSPTFNNSSNRDVASLHSTENTILSNETPNAIPDKKPGVDMNENSKTTKRSDSLQSQESSEEVVWLGEHRTGPYVQKAEPDDQSWHDIRSRRSRSPVMNGVSESAGAASAVPMQVPTVASSTGNGKTGRPPIETLIQLPSHHVQADVHDNVESAMPPPPPPPLEPACQAIPASLRQTWLTPRTPALSDMRGAESQLDVTPSAMFKSSVTNQPKESAVQPKPNTGRKPGRPRSRSRRKSVDPEQTTDAKDPEVVEAWSHLEDMKTAVELKEREKKKQAELAKIGRQKATLAKRELKVSKPPAKPGRKPRNAVSAPAAAPTRIRSLEERANDAKAVTQTKRERSFSDRSKEQAPRTPAEQTRSETSERHQHGAKQASQPKPPTSSSHTLPGPPDDFISELLASPSSDRDLNTKFSAWYEHQFQVKERSRPAGFAKHKFAAIPPNEIIPDDLLLMKLREVGVPWAEVHTEYCHRTGRSMREDTLRHRHLKLISTINEYLPTGKSVDVAPRKALEIERASNPSGDITVDGHGNAIANKSTKGKPTARNAQGYATTGGKSIDLDTWASMLRCSPSLSPSPQPLSRRYRSPSPITELDKVHYVYQAVLREVQMGSSQDYSDAEAVAVSEATLDLGAANDAAAKAFRELPKIAPYSWHTCYAPRGMQHWEGELEEERRKVQVSVVRSMRSFQEGVLPESKEGWVRSTVYVIRQQEVVFELVKEAWGSKENAIEIDGKSSSDEDENEDVIANGDDEIEKHKRNTDVEGDCMEDQDKLFEESALRKGARQLSSPSPAHPTTGAKRLPGVPPSHANDATIHADTFVPAKPSTPTTHPTEPIARSGNPSRRILSTSHPVPRTAIYTVQDMANREAAKLFMQRQRQLSGRPPHLDIIDQEKAEMDALLDALEDAGEAFDRRVEAVDGTGGTEVRIWVEDAPLRGPRNI